MLNYASMLTWLAVLGLLGLSQNQAVSWTAVPSVRTGQIITARSLTTAGDTDTNTTDTTAVYSSPLSLNSNLRYGLSLASYESWVTDSFSFNVSLVALSNTSITVRFLVLDNTFFTKAKVHYLVVWRPNAFPNNNISASPPIDPSPTGAYNNVDVTFGCYLTSNLMTGSGTRSVHIGGNVSSTIYANNRSAITITSMIAGMRLSNNLGGNNHVQVSTYFNGSGLIYYEVTVENNNYLEFICLTTVVHDPWVDKYYLKSIIKFQTMTLNATDLGLKNISYDERFDGNSRMFFGIDKFNLSMVDTRYLNIEISNISLVSLYYEKNDAMNEVGINMFFFAFQTCVNSMQYYNPFSRTCDDSCPISSIPYPNSTAGPASYLLCNPCHYSCSTCSSSQNSLACTACPSGSNRILPGGVSCPCQFGYADIGLTTCVLCSAAMPGCVSCSSSSYCLDCNNITYVLDSVIHLCTCTSGYYKASGFCLSYSGCLEATLFNNTLACISCDTSLNYVRKTSNNSCACNEGYTLNASLPDCYDICGDGITALGLCDDNNTEYGDGCDQLCQVEQGYHCYTNYSSSGDPGLSICILVTNVGVSYLYSKRIINTNTFIMAFKLDPIKSGMATKQFDSTNFVTTLPIKNQQISYDPATAIVYLEAEYLESIESTSHTLAIAYPNDYSFYADSTVTQFTAAGINAQLTLDQKAEHNDVLGYLIMGEGFLTILIAIFASVVGLKLAGIELLIPVQLLYFSLAAMGSQSSFSSNLVNLKYSNGYSALVAYEISRTYAQNKNLVAMTYESQFLLSTNLMLGIFVIIMIWLFIHNFIIKRKENALEQLLAQKGTPVIDPLAMNKSKEVNSDESQEQEGEADEEGAKLSRKSKRKERQLQNQKQMQQQNELREDHHYSLKIFSFEVDRAYFISYVILVNQMLFGFTVMSLNLPLAQFYYAEEISVMICHFLTLLVLGNTVFIFYDQTSNKMINFTCINDRYAYLYLLLNFLLILVISYTFQTTWALYLITALTALYVLLVVLERPYSKTILDFENMVALYLALMLLICEIMFCIIKVADLQENFQLIITFMIVSLIFIGQVLTIIRVVLKVNFKKAFDDLKNPNSDRDNDNKKKLRVKEKNLDLLGKDNAEVLPPDSVRNGLFTPKDKMIDWEARNTEEYESARLREGNHDSNNEEEANNSKKHEELSEGKDNKLNELELLKKRLRNTLKVKRETEAKKSE